MGEEKSLGMKNLKSLKSRKLYFQVYDEIKEHIRQNHLEAGDKLPTEMEMCEILGVSRNVLREAIKSLEITGVVCSKPGVGMIIQEFSTDFLFRTLLYNLTGDSDDMLRQTLEVRRTLELGFVRQAFDSITPTQRTEIAAQVERMKRILKKNIEAKRSLAVFGEDFSEADAMFHKLLYLHVDNRILQSIIDAVWSCDKYHKRRSPRSYMEMTVEKHVRILEALEACNYDRFYEAMLFHFNVQYKAGVLPSIQGDFALDGASH